MQQLGPAHLLDPRAAEKLNLAVLKRIDPATEQVLPVLTPCLPMLP
jgi:hypothetical protein